MPVIGGDDYDAVLIAYEEALHVSEEAGLLYDTYMRVIECVPDSYTALELIARCEGTRD